MQPQTETATQELPAGTQPEAGYDVWLAEQLAAAVIELDDGRIERIAHADVMAELRDTVAKYEAQ